MSPLRWSAFASSVVFTLVACGGRVDSGSSNGGNSTNNTNNTSSNGKSGGSGSSTGNSTGSSGGSSSGGGTTGSSGADGGSCDGAIILQCLNGVITDTCCPAGDPCIGPQPFCDNGDGTCESGESCADGGTCASIEADDYDQTCTQDSDCVTVFSGSVCSECYCPNDTINRNAETAYEADFAADGPGNGVCGCPETAPPTCNAAGRCVILPP